MHEIDIKESKAVGETNKEKKEYSSQVPALHIRYCDVISSL